MGARAGGTLGKDPWSPGVGSDRDLPSRSILRGLRLEPLLGLWLRRADRFGEWPPARGGRGKGEEVVNGKKWSSRANLKELGRISTTKFPAGQRQGSAGRRGCRCEDRLLCVFVWPGVQSFGKVEFGVEL